MGILLFFIFIIWVVSMIAETHLAPFGFFEGESEFVLGFIIEYGVVRFALLFIA